MQIIDLVQQIKNIFNNTVFDDLSIITNYTNQ